MILRVRRSRLVWLVCAPLALAGSLAAHSSAYRLLAADSHEHQRLLARSGHGYLELIPFAAAAALALALLALAVTARRAAHGVPAPAPAWRVALVAPLAFALQEHLERLAHTGAFPFGAVLEPTFVLGLLLQLPFALVAMFLARMLLGAAEALGAAWTRTPPAWPGEPGRGVRAPWVPRRSPLALGRAQRAPPPPALC